MNGIFCSFTDTYKINYVHYGLWGILINFADDTIDEQNLHKHIIYNAYWLEPNHDIQKYNVRTVYSLYNNPQ